MTEVVLDTSAVLPWCFDDEATDASQELLSEVEFGRAFVPSLFPIEVDETTPREAYGPIADLARETGLTVYDACYVALAIRLDVAIATRDTGIIEVARRRAIKLIAA